MATPPTWVNEKWEDDDIFKLSKVSIDQWKLRIAEVLGYRWRAAGQGANAPFANAVAGVEPITQEKVNAALKEYMNELRTPPTDADRMEAWRASLQSKSQLSTVVNGCFINWEPVGGPWNTGYIASFWSKFASGEKAWDSTLERKAGGIALEFDRDVDLDNMKFTVVNATSVMALVRAVLGHVVRTGTCPEDLKIAFGSLRITWLFGSTQEQILTLSIADNIDQHNRRRHTELDNIFQVMSWIEGVKLITSPSLDSTKAIDIVKFALAQGDPMKPDDAPDWLRALLLGKPATFKNRLAALCTKGVTKRFLEDKRAKINHPEMSTYAKVVLRVRAVLGFHEFHALHKEVNEEIGRKGLAHKPFPLTPALLLDPNILTSDAFTGSEKNSVPQWRDGAAGRELQKAMVDVARRRLFEFDMASVVASGGKMAFASGVHWVAFARFNGPPYYHVEACLEKHFDQKSRWPDGVKTFYVGFMVGESDPELAKLSCLFPAALDSQPMQLQKRLCEMFPPLLHLLQTKDSEAARLASAQEKQAEEAKKEEAKKEDEKKEEQSTAVHAVHDGDVTDELFKDQSASSKRNLCNALNKDAVKKREAALDREFHAAAIAIFRSRLVVVEDALAVKSYMESASKEGLKARIAYMDLSQYPSLTVKGKWSKNLAKEPSKEFQKHLAQKVQLLPVTPITGSLILRSCYVSLESFNTDVAQTFPAKYQKTLFVPIDLPKIYEARLKSAAARSLGPSARNERSGIEFQFRAIGGRASSDDDDEDKQQKKKRDGEEDEEDEDDDMDEEEGLDNGDGSESMIPIESMNAKQLRGLFGREALNIMGAMFQHTSQIGEPARFQTFDKCVQTKTPSGKLEIYRKSQIHPSAVYSALNLAMASTSAGISPGECFVQLSGGTPEPLVGAIMAGFSKVFYVAQNTTEANWMKVPSAHEEKVHDIDYTQYVSPNPDIPDQGFMIVEAAKMLAPYIKNFTLETPNSLMVPSPVTINVPPLQTYTYIAVTGKVIARTIQHQPSEQSKKSNTTDEPVAPSSAEGSKSTAASSSGGPGSSSGDKPPSTPKLKGAINAGEEAQDDDDDDENEVDDDGEAGEAGEDEELAELEALQAQHAPTPKKKQGKKRKGGTPKGSAKKTAK